MSANNTAYVGRCGDLVKGSRTGRKRTWVPGMPYMTILAPIPAGWNGPG